MSRKNLGGLGGVVLICMCLASLGHGNDKVVYGDDNRVDVENSPVAIYQEWAKSTAAMIRQDKLKLLENGLSMQIKVEANSHFKICEDEPFAKQAMAANCTGFLVGPDLLVTAGHCFQSATACSDYVWVFEYQTDKIGREGAPRVAVDNVYSCKNVITKVVDQDSKLDYALVRLNKRVKDRFPLPIRTDGEVELGTHMVVIGHPSGLPMKIADQAYVRKNDHQSFFVVNADTFQGNSGSPVFDADTGYVEGILVRGDRDYNYNFEKQCYSVVRCAANECRGEDVTRITQIPQLKSEELE